MSKVASNNPRRFQELAAARRAAVQPAAQQAEPAATRAPTKGELFTAMTRAKRNGTPEEYAAAEAAFRSAAAAEPSHGTNFDELLADAERILRERGEAPRVPGQMPGAPDDALARARAHASRLPPSVEGHGGDAALWHAAQELATLGLNEDDCVLVLRENFVPRCTQAGAPWTEHEVRHKAQRAVEEQTKLWEMYPPARARALAVAQAVPLTSADAHYSPATGGAPAGDDPWPMRRGSITNAAIVRDYRVQEFEWGEGRPLGLLGTFNASKTLTSKQILVDYALGRAVLGKYKVGTRNTGKVLDLCYEQFTKAEATYKRLARGIALETGRALDDVLEELNQLIEFGRPERYLSDGMTRPANPELREYTERLLMQKCTGFDICNVDPYSAAALGLDENSSEFQGPARMLERVSEATGCAFMINTHAGRDEEKKHSRGHSSLDDAFDTTIMIAKVSDDAKDQHKRNFTCLKRPMYGFEPEVLSIIDVNEDGTLWERRGDERESWGVRVRAAGAASKYSKTVLDNAGKVRDAANSIVGWHSQRALGKRAGISNSESIAKACEAAHALGYLHVRRDTVGKNDWVYSGTEPNGAEPTGASAALDRAQGQAGSKYAGIVARAGGLNRRTPK